MTAKFLAYAAFHLRCLIGRRPRFLGLMAHMRSRSTLLGNLLASHPEIAGRKEYQMPYRNLLRVRELYGRIAREDGAKVLFRRYIQDKINHDGLVLCPELVTHPHTRLVFLIRAPAPTLASIVRLMPDDYPPPLAADYYVQRLQTLEKLHDSACAAGTPWFAIESDALVADPGPVLAGLTRFLELRRPLNPTYQVHQDTGKEFRAGDLSPHIRSGRIVATPSAAPLPLAPDLLVPAEAAYQRLRSRLRLV